MVGFSKGSSISGTLVPYCVRRSKVITMFIKYVGSFPTQTLTNKSSLPEPETPSLGYVKHPPDQKCPPSGQ